MSENINKTGGCQCGLIRYRISGAPVGCVSVCHCRMCQKAMGNAFGIFATYHRDDFSWTRGVPTKFRSSSIGYRLFCSNCGTPLAFLSVDEQTIEITIGSLDCPSEVPPTEQVGIENTLVWTKSLSNLPGQTTYEQNIESRTMVNYQHPDHETSTDEWLQKMTCSSVNQNSVE